MRTLKLLVLAAVATLGCWALVASALDSPHDGSYAASPTDCFTCHSLHASTGGTLLGGTYTSNNDACLTCHDSAVAYTHPNSQLFKDGWSTGREAVPGTGGDQHKWSGPSVVNAAGATTPINAALLKNLTGGALQCAVCHDSHGIRSATASIQAGLAPTSVHASLPLNTGVARVFPILPASAARMKLIAISGAKPMGYGIKITKAAPNGTFVISHDYGRQAAKTWGTTTYTFNLGDTSAQDVALDDTAVKIRFLDTAPEDPQVGDEWAFYVSYPFLTMSNVADAMCLDCHRSRHQSYQNVEGTGTIVGTGAAVVPGTTVFSHPVGQALNANMKSYDRTTPLDADGSTADANASNDVKLVNGVVSCTSCHAPHNADSNSLSVDVR
jgi:predicted CXXCH cytochrome family protein